MGIMESPAGNYASSWFDVQNVPTNYAFPEKDRPGELPPVCLTLPVIDLGNATDADLVNQILKASQEFGFFQVINHGVSDKLLGDTSNVFKDFFEIPVKDNSNSSGKSNWIYVSSTSFDRDGVHLWRENIKHPCNPLKDCMQQWPENPIGYRDVVSIYLSEISKLGTMILDLICKGLGLEVGYFNRLGEVELLSANSYPPCPDPSLTLGLLRHHDPSIITILYQGNVPGLQVMKDRNWITVGAMPNAFVVNIGNQLEIFSNGMLKSVEHRVVTNSSEARLSIAAFINPSPDCIVEPAQALVTELNPARYKPTSYKEFVYINRALGNHTKTLQRE
ncbi:hyoscyamine 6-dioxygenase-like [Heracleum sosnowskyi]|uniref:Hyoscyamine 6-dioxygenase-like n=1 Tax=Heracleum sosnowskyi TaxID=360622 RepID=A0AAD8GZD7_9APIA|nr:hyoscyamine 6-dioxygenase-like [Heracleum sosnowskyi]